MHAAMPRAQSAQMRVGVVLARDRRRRVLSAGNSAPAVVDGAAQAWWTTRACALRAAGVGPVQAPSSGANLEYPMRNERFEIVDLRAGDFGSRGGGEASRARAAAARARRRRCSAGSRPSARAAATSRSGCHCRATPRGARRRRRLRPGYDALPHVWGLG